MIAAMIEVVSRPLTRPSIFDDVLALLPKLVAGAVAVVVAAVVPLTLLVLTASPHHGRRSRIEQLF